MQHVSKTAMSWLRSKWFFVFIMVLFVAEAVWIAVSGRYPMAFDEDFHLGIIQIYAHHVSPFFAHQPPGADSFGAVARDPSYLYHYLMSFPWRLVTAITHNFMAQVIIMRLINVGFFAASIPLFKRLLLKTKASAAMVHTVLFFFVLTPIVPLVAAQINYDNLLLPLSTLSLLLTIRFVERLETKKEIDTKTLAILLVTAMVASLVKYAYLPIFAGIVLYIGFKLYKVFEVGQKRFWQMFVRGYQKVVPSARIWLVLAVLLSTGLFVERYGVNTVRYKTPIPECNQVLSISECSAYGAWERNYLYETSKTARADWNPLSFSFIWARKLAFNLLFTLNGIQSGFGIGQPLPVPRILARAIAYIGLPLVLVYGVKLLRDKTLRFLLFVSALYLAALWLQNYQDFLHLGQQVAVQGRYLLPILPIMYLTVAQAFARLLSFKPQLKLALMGVATICLLLGGGVLTFILHSDQSWYWPNRAIIEMNTDVQKALDPVIPGSKFITT